MPMNPRLLRPTASGFNPRSIPNLALWLDASDTGQVTLVSGAVSAWNDKSGNGRNATQSTPNSRPGTTTVNGRQALIFNGTSHQMEISAPWSSAITFFWVSTPSTQNDTYLFASSGTGASPTILSRYLINSIRRDYTWWAASGADTENIATTAAGTNVISVTHTDGSTVTGFLNGTQAFSKATAVAAFSGLSMNRIGAASAAAAFCNATICEILMYHRVLSVTERKRVESALGRKWGVTVA